MKGLSVGRRGKPRFESQRPEPEKRCFVSRAVEETIAEVTEGIADAELAWLFANCFPNTLDTTVETGTRKGRPDTFVITGDIDAMWLRDSTAQVWPYVSLAGQDEDLARLIAGVVNRQTACILIDPYANAFNKEPRESRWASDLTEMKPELHERKWELDSLCYAVRLGYGYWKATGDTGCFDGQWAEAMGKVVETLRTEQCLKGPSPYRFQRTTTNALDTLANRGYGNPGKPCGLIRSAFRPSDDACIFPYLVPSNMFAVAALRQLAEMCEAVGGLEELAGRCVETAKGVEEAVQEHCIVEREGHGRVYAYEVDGYGSRLLMDDANAPSLLSLPYFGGCALSDETYQNTRRLVLSRENPYSFEGSAGRGIGSYHSGVDRIWTLSISMRALTSQDEGEVRECLGILRGSHAGTGFMHESFHKERPEEFSRPWFAWANTLFGEMVLRVFREMPEVLSTSW